MIWPTPLESFKNLSDVEIFLKHTLLEINDQMGDLEKHIVSGDNGVTYEWVTEQIDEKVTHLEATIDRLEEQIVELKKKCEK